MEESNMEIETITEEIIAGKRLTGEDDLKPLLQTDLNRLTACADKLRQHFSGDSANLCSIINGRSGRCSEDCKFCAQSAHHCTGITEPEILRTVAIFRFLVPEADIRLAAGRNLMENCGERAFRSGANAAITGDMLTTSGNRIREDIAMLRRIGYAVKSE